MSQGGGSHLDKEREQVRPKKRKRRGSPQPRREPRGTDVDGGHPQTYAPGEVVHTLHGQVVYRPSVEQVELSTATVSCPQGCPQSAPELSTGLSTGAPELLICIMLRPCEKRKRWGNPAGAVSTHDAETTPTRPARHQSLTRPAVSRSQACASSPRVTAHVDSAQTAPANAEAVVHSLPPYVNFVSEVVLMCRRTPCVRHTS